MHRNNGNLAIRYTNLFKYVTPYSVHVSSEERYWLFQRETNLDFSGENVGVAGEVTLGAGGQEEEQRRDEDPDSEREHEDAPERDGAADRAGEAAAPPSSSSAAAGDREASRAAELDIDGLPDRKSVV